MNCQFKLLHPPAGGCIADATIALTIGAPAKIIDIMTAGLPPTPNPNTTPNAPMAPTVPAIVDQTIPFAGKLHVAPLEISIAADPMTAISK